MRTKLLVVALLVAAPLILGGRSWAAGGVTIGPAMKEVVINAEDEEITFEVTLINRDPEVISARLKALNFKALDESGGIAFAGASSDELETKYGLTSWLSFSKDIVTLEPGVPEKITAIISNRDSLAPGGHYGAIVVTPVDLESQEANSKVEIVPSTATLVLAKKVGGETYGLEHKDTLVSRSGLSFPDRATVRFQNTGNIHVVPRGTVTIQDPLGRTISKAIINSDSGVILPETFRKYPTSFSQLLRPVWPGRYSVVTQWRYDGRDDVQESVVKFYYYGSILYLLIFITCITLICIVAIKTSLIHKIIHRRKKPAA